MERAASARRHHGALSPRAPGHPASRGGEAGRLRRYRGAALGRARAGQRHRRSRVRGDVAHGARTHPARGVPLRAALRVERTGCARDRPESRRRGGDHARAVVACVARAHDPRFGVDVVRFAPVPEPPSPPVRVVYGGRLLWSKGVRELVAAGRELKARAPAVEIVLAGDPDVENPESIPTVAVQSWVRDGLVSHVPWTDDMTSVWRNAHIAVLPSYREGLPKALLEAAACGRPIVATDVPGCREIARDGVNALVVPPRDAHALALAIERLAGDAGLRARLGAAGRELVVNEYAESIVVRETLDLYRRLCGTPASS